VIAALASSVIAILFVGSVDAVLLLVALVVAQDAVGLVELVRGAGELASLALGSRAVVFILALVAVPVEVALPPQRDALAVLAALELVASTSLTDSTT
jgi:hypothetical protein